MTHCFLPHRRHPRSNAHPEVPQNTAEVGTSKTGSTTDITPVLANKVHKKWKWQQHSLLVTELLPHCSQKNPVCLKHGRAGALGCAVARPRAHSSHSGSSAMSGHFWKAQGMGCGRRIGYKKKKKKHLLAYWENCVGSVVGLERDGSCEKNDPQPDPTASQGTVAASLSQRAADKLSR